MPVKIIVSISLLLLGSFVKGQVVAPTDNTGSLDAGMNWHRSKIYDVSGNITNDSKVFYDKANRKLQDQQKFRHRLSNGTIVTHVFASQPLYDALGRPVAQTLSAPIDASQFIYKSNFIRNAGGTTYDYRNFDKFNPSGTETDKTNNPDQVGGQAVTGTLGWYFGTNNNWEPYTPNTNFPFSRSTFYADGSGNAKKNSAGGEVFKMGTGRESSEYITPVISELSHYILVRNTFFTASEIGDLPAGFERQAIQTVGQDVNGSELITMQDKSGNHLIKARPGTDLTITNTVNLKRYPYSYTLPVSPTGGGCTFGTQVIKVYGSGTGGSITNLSSATLNFTGPMNGTTLNITPTDWGSTIRSDAPFQVIYMDKQGGGCSNVQTQAGSQNSTSTAAQQHYFKILADNSDVTITGTYVLLNMATELSTSLLGGNKLNRGYYKLVDTSGDVTLTYTNKLTDVSYQFYNQLGQLIATIAPEGVKKLYGSGISNYPTKYDVPFITLYEYDSRGRLIKLRNADGGITEFVYRKDGKIRFSQNAIQQLTGRYSYTNYDARGRLIESGEYQPDGSGIAFNSDLSVSSNMKNILEDVSSTGGLTTGTKNTVILTTYDIANATHGVAGYVQNELYLRNVVSMSEKLENVVNNNYAAATKTAQTWYNYDEYGNVLWSIEFINGLGSKTKNYTYDADGRITKVVFQQNTAAETFVHYYEYDGMQRLEKVYTNTVDNPATKVLRATYFYYLHGPLKRIQLATNLQGIDYTYTLGGMVKAINNSNKNADPGGDGPNGTATDAYGMVLDYFPDDYVNSRAGVQALKGVNSAAIGSTSYAGNIKAMSWFSKKPASLPGLTDDPITYVYQYDEKYQFTESTWGTTLNFANTPATFSTTTFNKEVARHPTGGTPAYDANGNITYLQRTNGSGTFTDKFTYAYWNSVTASGSTTNYNTNRLHNVSNDASGTPVTYATYNYDAIGQLISEVNVDPNKSKYIRYDAAGKVKTVARDAAFTQKIVEYEYNAAGHRTKKILYNSSFVVVQVTYYVDDVIYTQPVTSGGTVYGTITVQEYEIDGVDKRLGVFYRPADIYAYPLTDHLGNTRAVIAQSGLTYEVRMYTDFYPYGMVIQQGGTNDYRYGYQGNYSEKDPETDWNAFELRMYDSRIARWLTVDPNKEFWSSYAAMGNDPVNRTDPDGGSTEDIIVKDKNGNHLFTLNDGKTEITTMTTMELYKAKIQWFEPLADNYMAVKWMNPNIGKLESLKHFTWDDIVKFAEVDRPLESYASKNSGDWKYVDEGADGWLMSTINGYPYWSDAVGQLPFAIGAFRNLKMKDPKNNHVIADILQAGFEHSAGQLFGGDPDLSNTYDNYMILRGAYWANSAYHVASVYNAGHYQGVKLGRSKHGNNELGKSIVDWQKQRWLNMLR